MAITATDGPIVTFPSQNTTSLLTQSNPEAGPSVFMHGLALADPRQQFAYLPGQNFGKQVSGWMSLRCQTIDQVPSTAIFNSIVAATGVVIGTAFPLTAATGVTSGVSIVRADTGATVTGLLAIDSAMTTVKFGSAQTIQAWDPTVAIARNVRISANGTASGATFTVAGYDLYGFPLTETITGPNGTGGAYAATAGAKAFKYIASVTPVAGGTASATGFAVGHGDIVGLPLRADRWTELSATVGNTSITLTTGFIAAVTTSPATALTGDVRGTYGLQTSSNGVLRLSVYQSPQVSNCSTSAGLLGVAQV